MNDRNDDRVHDDAGDPWYSRGALELQRRGEEAETAFRRMIRRQNRFQAAVARLGDDADPEEVARLWEASDLDDFDETNTETP